MQIIPLLLKELEQEAQITHKMLERVPDDKFDWKPHPKSMSIRHLATHLAEISAWPAFGLQTSELDFATMDYKPTEVHSTKDLLDLLDKSVASAKAALEKASDEDLLPTWTMRSGETIHAVYTKYEMIRHSIAQTIHHRAQLGVYLRLLNIPIPGSYGPSADDHNF